MEYNDLNTFLKKEWIYINISISIYLYTVEHLSYISHLYVFLNFTFFSFIHFPHLYVFKFQSQIIPLLSNDKIFRLYDISKFLFSLMHFFFLENPKFEIHFGIENKYALYLFYFLLPISRESIVFGSNFRSGDFDGFTCFEVPWIRKTHF